MTVLKTGRANLLRGRESVGGKLELDGKQLRFVPHDLNVQRDQVALYITDIKQLRPAWTKFLGIVPLAPNGLDVEMRNREVWHFTVGGRKDWIREIEAVFDDTRTR
ncbi:MAG: hypothetical protein Q7T55_22960 [Solirubrobacteraceae bacterium]|nr:hypothetical protein [Solirubrobacteraceae bacterium]